MITIGWFGRRCILWWMSRTMSVSSMWVVPSWPGRAGGAVPVPPLCSSQARLWPQHAPASARPPDHFGRSHAQRDGIERQHEVEQRHMLAHRERRQNRAAHQSGPWHGLRGPEPAAGLPEQKVAEALAEADEGAGDEGDTDIGLAGML